MQNNKGGETEKYDFMGQFQCPCCGKDKATVQHVIFECEGCEHTGIAFRVKMAASLDKCSNLLKDPKPDERSEAKENMGETSRLLKNGSGGATEQDLKPLCGLLPRPAKLKPNAFGGFMEEYATMLSHLKGLVDYWRKICRLQVMWVADFWAGRKLVRRLAMKWRLNSRILVRIRKRNECNLVRRLRNTGILTRRTVRRQIRLDDINDEEVEISIDEEVEDQGSEPDTQNTLINENEGGGAGRNRGRGRKKRVKTKQAIGRRSWLEASVRFNLDINNLGFEPPPPSMPG